VTEVLVGPAALTFPGQVIETSFNIDTNLAA
jgi:hypothetical protein